jgi:hypothetical protein
VQATPEKADKWPTSTLIRLMRYVAVQESAPEALDQLIKPKGGINVCCSVLPGCGKGSNLASQFKDINLK